MPDVLKCSLIYRYKHTLQYRSLICASWTHKVEKCVTFAITNGLSKNYPRKYRMIDQSPNRIRIFPEGFTPLTHTNRNWRKTLKSSQTLPHSPPFLFPRSRANLRPEDVHRARGVHALHPRQMDLARQSGHSAEWRHHSRVGHHGGRVSAGSPEVKVTGMGRVCLQNRTVLLDSWSSLWHGILYVDGEF